MAHQIAICLIARRQRVCNFLSQPRIFLLEPLSLTSFDVELAIFQRPLMTKRAKDRMSVVSRLPIEFFRDCMLDRAPATMRNQCHCTFFLLSLLTHLRHTRYI